jgi:hypothetical protein
MHVWKEIQCTAEKRQPTKQAIDEESSRSNTMNDVGATTPRPRLMGKQKRHANETQRATNERRQQVQLMIVTPVCSVLGDHFWHDGCFWSGERQHPKFGTYFWTPYV